MSVLTQPLSEAGWEAPVSDERARALPVSLQCQAKSVRSDTTQHAPPAPLHCDGASRAIHNRGAENPDTSNLREGPWARAPGDVLEL